MVTRQRLCFSGSFIFTLFVVRLHHAADLSLPQPELFLVKPTNKQVCHQWWFSAGLISHQTFCPSSHHPHSSSSSFSFSSSSSSLPFLSSSSSLQKFYKEKFNREKGKSSYSNMKTLPEVEHAMEVNKKQSDVNTLTLSLLLCKWGLVMEWAMISSQSFSLCGVGCFLSAG